MKMKVYPMGKKLGLYFPKEFLSKKILLKGDNILIKISKNNKPREFLAKFNYIITLRKEICKSLDLKPSEIVEINLSKIFPLDAPPYMFSEVKIDFLYLIKKIDLTKKFILYPLERNKEAFLKIWCCHCRGSCREIELKRFIDSDSFGRLLGLLQAEGTKGFRFKLEFVNKDIQEHVDYLSYLKEIGISKDRISAGLITHSDLLDSINFSEFESRTDIKIKQISKSSKGKRGYGFRLVLRSSIIAEIILGSMDYLRDLLANSKWDEDLKLLASGFFAKLLNGDGSIELLTKNRKTPGARIKVVDQNLSYLEDYKKIMKKFGFNPHVDKKYIHTRSYANLENLLLLYKIHAFYKTNKWEKLIKIIKVKLRLAKNSSLNFTSLNEQYSDELSDFSEQD